MPPPCRLCRSATPGTTARDSAVSASCGGTTRLEEALAITGHDATPRQVARAWLLHRSPNVVLIPGTSSERHLEEEPASARLRLSERDPTRLDTIG